MTKTMTLVSKATCPLCTVKLPRRNTHLYKPMLNAWICQSCWDIEINTQLKENVNG
jgi:hypothetical protein